MPMTAQFVPSMRYFNIDILNEKSESVVHETTKLTNNFYQLLNPAFNRLCIKLLAVCSHY